MGILNAVVQLAKARMVGRLLRRGIGGKLGTALMIAYLGKKAYGAMQARRRSRLAYPG